MRIAVVADVHGNLPALRAVLAECDAEQVDAIVVGGDVVAGPMPRDALETLAARPEPVHWISGNAERETVAVFDGAEPADGPPGRAARWSANMLDTAWRDALASWPIRLEFDGVCFCHGSPRRDDEILTRATPEDVLREALAGVEQPLVIGGHTHQQMLRDPGGGPVYANAGSVGMPYEGRAGAFWAIVDGGEVDLRSTSYDLDAALAELRATGYPDLDDLVAESLVRPVDPDWVTAFFEHGVGRGPDPGPQPTAAP
jgi:predicted phosphodiesterase